MSSDDDKPPTGLSDDDLDMAGGWLFEGCYKYEIADARTLTEDAANLGTPPGSGKT